MHPTNVFLLVGRLLTNRAEIEVTCCGTNQPFVLEATSDLATNRWDPVATNELPCQQFVFVDALSNACRFYRGRLGLEPPRP